MGHQIDLFDVLDPEDPNFDRYTSKNPLTRALGFGPEGTKCKQCKFLYRKHYSKTYIKCEKRGDTNGEGTDHRANWPSCILYEPVVSSQD